MWGRSPQPQALDLAASVPWRSPSPDWLQLPLSGPSIHEISEQPHVDVHGSPHSSDVLPPGPGLCCVQRSPLVCFGRRGFALSAAAAAVFLLLPVRQPVIWWYEMACVRSRPAKDSLAAAAARLLLLLLLGHRIRVYVCPVP
jgi:hypothetical protein